MSGQNWGGGRQFFNTTGLKTSEMKDVQGKDTVYWITQEWDNLLYNYSTVSHSLRRVTVTKSFHTTELWKVGKDCVNMRSMFVVQLQCPCLCVRGMYFGDAKLLEQNTVQYSTITVVLYCQLIVVQYSGSSWNLMKEYSVAWPIVYRQKISMRVYNIPISYGAMVSYFSDQDSALKEESKKV